ncbi:MAG: hypothetical protein ABI568_00125 [Pseudarthrobacter sp.]
MAGIWRSGGLAATTAALTLPLWLGSCTPGSIPSGGGVPAGATAIDPTERPGAVPVPAPQPQAPPPPAAGSPPLTVAAATAPVEAALPPPYPAPAASAGAPMAGSSTAPVPGAGTVPGTNASIAPRPSPTAEVSAPPPATPSERAPAQQTTTRPVTAYYVLLDDGGAKGVRFGCNDSLAGVRRSAAGPADPLAAAMNALLDGSVEPAPGLYNALSASTLTFLSGTFDGYTVTVYLSGGLRPGGVCDIPRVEAQLTQTAVASVGAIRADVYVNGVGLAEALSVK